MTAVGACDDVTADFAAGTITGFDDCADSMPATAQIVRSEMVRARILVLASRSGCVDSRHPNIFCDCGELRINLGLVLCDRDLLNLHFFGDREDFVNLLLACGRSLSRGSRD